MLYQIKKKIDIQLSKFLQKTNKAYSLETISPLLFKNISDFILRDGKRIRPTLFIVGYQGFSKKKVSGLYESALSVELLHDFFLIHDDIIDKSNTRRGKPSLHKVFDKFLAKHNNIKFNGQDLAIVAADIIYALAIKSFLSIKENSNRKEKALQRFIKATVHTGCGEFIELLSGIKNIEEIEKKDIYKIYDYKTAHYTFASPLSMGAILAGTKQSEIDKLSKFSLYLGRAFQIKDDLLSMFFDEKKIGKSTLSDLQESKKTLLIWHAYNHTSKKNKSLIKSILNKKQVTKTDLLKIRRITKESGALNYVQKEINNLTKKAKIVIKTIKMKKKYRNLLSLYAQELGQDEN
ncbi:MAG: polyprenyl synthetase family protein [Candidatus Susulua stagnicola]|nr:polyprenyl synthetase family protein [Candidatus Susulua stagnicola]